MIIRNIFRKINSAILNFFFAVEERKISEVQFQQVEKILIIRQHNQFGDMLASVSLFCALKEKFPNAKLTLLASPENYFAVQKNKFVDELFVFDKKKLFSKNYFISLKKVLRQNFDIAIVPVTVAISNTSCILCALSDAKQKIGPASLNGKENLLKKLFHYRINLDWRKHQDAHVSDFILDVVRPFGIKTKDFSSSISYDEKDLSFAKEFINSFRTKNSNMIFGFHVGAAKPQNRWSLYKYTDLILELQKDFNFDFYFTGSNADKEQINFMKNKFPKAGYFLNNSIPQLAALISISDLFITNDTGVMHVAGTTETKQISIFGPTNPFNWAPIGKNKYFIRKSDLIDEVEVDDVIQLVKYLFSKNEK